MKEYFRDKGSAFLFFGKVPKINIYNQEIEYFGGGIYKTWQEAILLADNQKLKIFLWNYAILYKKNGKWKFAEFCKEGSSRIFKIKLYHDCRCLDSVSHNSKKEATKEASLICKELRLGGQKINNSTREWGYF